MTVNSIGRLLLVEDHRQTREGYRDFLSGAGFDVHALEGGGEAMEFARTVTPDLIVLDLGLPDLNGWEVARRLKADSHTKDIPIIAFSARTLQHEKVSALRAGCDVYLAKPCQPDRLLNAINKLLAPSR
jgi:two-component system, cell cycle response regulator DivK